MTQRSRGPVKQPWRDDRLWQAGFLVGSALGAAATVLGRRAELAARRGLVDWSQAERIAIGRLRSAPGALTPDELRATEPEYAAAMATIVPGCRRPSARSCPASSSGRASRTGPAGSGRT